MSFWEKYCELCIKNNETPNGVAKKLGFSSAVCTHWKKNGNTPSDTKLLSIAKYFNVSVEYFKEDKAQPDDILIKQDNEHLRYIPVYESVSAGFGTNANDYILDYIPVYIHSDLEAENTIAIKVSGDSMYPKIEDGDIIVVHKQYDIDNKKIAVVNVDDSYFVKQILIENNSIILHSLNPEYQDRVYTGQDRNKIKLVGIVKKIVKEV